MTGQKGRSGGKRAGAGRPPSRDRVSLILPPEALLQYRRMATSQRTTVELVLKRVLLDYLNTSTESNGGAEDW